MFPTTILAQGNLLDAGNGKVIISGNAPDYAGETIFIDTKHDLISGKQTSFAQIEIAKDGTFSTTISTNKTILTTTKLGIYKGYLYLVPGKKYDIDLPPKKEKTQADIANPFFKYVELVIGVRNSDENELNFLINEFEYNYNALLDKNISFIYLSPQKNKVEQIIDTLEKQHNASDNVYFDVYKHYKYAILRYISYSRNNRHFVEQNFANLPVHINNIAYLEAFNLVFKRYFKIFSATKYGEGLSDAINEKSLSNVKAIFRKSPLFVNDTLCELVILKSLNDAYYAKNYPTKTIVALLDSIVQSTNYEEHKVIANNIKANILKLLIGYPAPRFELTDRNGKLRTVESFGGKFVYLNFMNSKLIVCKNQLETLKKFHDKYKKFLDIVTISVDENFDDMLQLADKQKYRWTFLHFANQKEILNLYDVITYPTYYVIAPDGNLKMSPAPAPEYEFLNRFGVIFDAYRREQIRKNNK